MLTTTAPLPPYDTIRLLGRDISVSREEQGEFEALNHMSIIHLYHHEYLRTHELHAFQDRVQDVNPDFTSDDIFSTEMFCTLVSAVTCGLLPVEVGLRAKARWAAHRARPDGTFVLPDDMDPENTPLPARP